MEWSDYQRAVFRATAEQDDNLVVRARAGSGKTTTAVAALDHAAEGGKIMVAFNKHIARELQRRINDEGTTVRTLHSLGYATLRQHWGGGIDIDENKGQRIAHTVARDIPEPDDEIDKEVHKKLPQILRFVTSYFKNTQPANAEEAALMLDDLELNWGSYTSEQMVEWATKCLRLAADERFEIDFDDMIYFPRRFGLMPAPHSLVVVDETQDLNRGQLWLVLNSGTRVIAIGDEKQAIYRWRGADAAAMQRVIDDLHACVLPLSITYRCPREVVAYVRETLNGLDDFEARPGAPEGAVNSVGNVNASAGDFVLSRWNAPLVPEALRHIKNRKRVCVLGHDLVKRMTGIIKRSNCKTPPDLIKWARDQILIEEDKLQQEGREHLIPAMQDRYQTLIYFARYVSTLGDLQALIRRVFTDTPTKNSITFSTVHKAKGHERDRVWLLMRGIKEPGENEEEDNIHYVAATRAKSELNLCWGD